MNLDGVDGNEAGQLRSRRGAFRGTTTARIPAPGTLERWYAGHELGGLGGGDLVVYHRLLQGHAVGGRAHRRSRRRQGEQKERHRLAPARADLREQERDHDATRRALRNKDTAAATPATPRTTKASAPAATTGIGPGFDGGNNRHPSTKPGCSTRATAAPATPATTPTTVAAATTANASL